MDKNVIKIAGIVYKNDENDFSIWFPDLTESDNHEINKFLEKFINNGYSTRGSKQDIINELDESIF